MIEFNKDLMTEEDLLNAANSIFKSQEEDFYKIKNEKWYQTLFHAITLNRDGKKYTVKGINSLSNLQKLFMSIYVRNYRKSHEQLDDTIEAISNISKAIKQQYESCILKLEKQEDLSTLSANDSEILALFLGEYRNEDGKVPEIVQIYNRGVLSALQQKIPNGNLDEHQIQLLENPKIVYRCFLEQCAVDGTMDSQDWSDRICKIIEDFEIGIRTKNQIRESVRKEVEAAGEDYLLIKYNKDNWGILDSDFDVDLDNKYDRIEGDELAKRDNDGIIVLLNTLKLFQRSEYANFEVTSEIAKKFFSTYFSYRAYYWNRKLPETTHHVIYEKDKKIYFFSKKTGESIEFNINSLLAQYYHLSEATSDDVIDRYVLSVFRGIKEFGNGFFFSIGPFVLYIENCENPDNCRLIIDLSNVWNKKDEIIIKGIQSDYLIFSYEKNKWCLLNISSGEILKPGLLQGRKCFIIKDGYIYYSIANMTKNKKNKCYEQYEQKTTSVQIFQHSLITGMDNPASKEIYSLISQQDGLGVCTEFDRVNDNFVMLRRVRFDSNDQGNIFQIIISTVRESYLYMGFDAHFNPITGNYFNRVDENDVFDAYYIKNGIVIFRERKNDCWKWISLITGKVKPLKHGYMKHGYMKAIATCGNYFAVNEFDIINTIELQ